MLKIKKMHPEAKLPTVSHPGTDLGFDIYALEDVALLPGVPTKVRTGIAAYYESEEGQYGLLIRDRSSMASNGVMVSGGVIDAGYRGEIVVVFTNTNRQAFNSFVGTGQYENVVTVMKGDKIAQMIPIPVLTACEVKEVEELPGSARGENGFGSSGR